MESAKASSLIVEIAKLDALRARIASRVCQDDVLDLRPPETFDSDRLAAARDDVLRDGANQCDAIEAFDDRSKRDLDDDRQDVAKLNGVCGRVKGQFARNIRAERGLDIHEERVADQSREDAHAILFQRFANDEARLAPVRCDDVAFLNRSPFRHITERDVDRVFRRRHA